MARELSVDVMVGFGGGSTMDAAKGIAVAATHPGNILNYSAREKGSQFILLLSRQRLELGANSRKRC